MIKMELFLSYVNPDNAWNNNVYQDIVVPKGRTKLM